MSKLCPNCHYIGKGKHSFLSGNIYLAILDFVAVAIILYTGQVFGSKIVGLLFGIFFLLVGVKNVIEYYKGGNICPSCNYKPMIPLDKREAQQIIKENNLTIPSESPEQTKAQST